MHTDMKEQKWMNALPSAIRPYVQLMRLDRPIGIWLLLLPAWWSILLASGGVMAMNKHDAWMFTLFTIGAIVMRGAGCVINDLWDRELDAKVTRTKSRPLASGAVTPRQALVFLLALLCVGLFILAQMNIVTILLGILTVPLIIIYPLMKRMTWWPQAFLGLVFNFGALMGWSAIAVTIQPSALLLYAAGVFWTLGYDTVYAHQDREDDALIGVKSAALRLGDRSVFWVRGFYIISWCLIVLAIFASAHIWNLAVLIVAGVYMARALRGWDADDPMSALDVFKSSRNYGLLIALACAI